jgi:hypothetical protein
MFIDVDPLICAPGELLAAVVDDEPGLMVMSALLMVDRAALGPDDAITWVQIHERVTAWWASLQVAALVAAAEPEPRIDAARLLAGPLAATHEALSLGEITMGHVRVVVEQACRLPGRWMRDDAETATFTAACGELQRRVLPNAKRGTLSMTRAASKRAVLAIDAAGERRRRELARCTRDVWVRDEADGISMLVARMATEQAHAVMTAIDAKAHDDRLEVEPSAVMGERRVAALAALVLGGDGATTAPARMHLDIVVDLPTFLGMNQDAVQIRGADPVSPDVLRDLLADPDVAVTMRRLVTDPLTGRLLDYGRRTYAGPQAPGSSSRPATGSAGSPAADAGPACVRSTTRSPGTTGAPPAHRTSGPCASGITS